LDIPATLNNVTVTIAGTLEIDKNSGLTLDNASSISILSGGSVSTTHPANSEIISIGGVKKYVGNVDGTISGPAYASSTSGTSPSGFSSTPITLPVTFVSFSATRRDREDVTLDWTTVSETNNSHFEVERSTDGTNFTVIGKVAAGPVSQEDSYQFADAAASGAATWYRLRQVDIDGQAQYSRIVLLPATTTEKTTVVAIGKTVNIMFAQQTTGPITARLITLNGQVLQQEIFQAASSTLTLTTTSVPSGIYIVYLSDNKAWSLAKKIIL
jgi:hypothetical protein